MDVALENQVHKGIALSPGIGLGPALVLGDVRLPVVRRSIAAADVAGELSRFQVAVQRAQRHLLTLEAQIRQTVGAPEADIFHAQVGMLQDPTFQEDVTRRCAAEKINIEAAVAEVIQQFSRLMDQLPDPLLRERASDIRDIGRRVLDVLLQDQAQVPLAPPAGAILVATELYPSTTARMNLETIQGVVLERGGNASHSAIILRSLGIPGISGIRGATQAIRTGDQLLVDGLAGAVFVNPTPAILREYAALQAVLAAHRSALKDLISLPAVTRDGVSVLLAASIGKSADAQAATLYGADAIGLFRSEFAFLVRQAFPTEEEQYQIYRSVAEHMHPRPVTIRLLDLGGDKDLPYFPLPLGTNPALGRTGIRILLAYPEILKPQLRALLRVGAEYPVRVLLPMVTQVQELRTVKDLLHQLRSDLTREDVPCGAYLPLGVMIETPAAAVMARALAREADFLSIGSNDLTQYMLVADRANPEIAAYFDPLDPAFLRTLASVIAAATAEGKPLSLCGEMAAMPAYTELLLGLGLRSLSVPASELLEIKARIRSMILTDAQALAQDLLGRDTAQEIRATLLAHNARLDVPRPLAPLLTP